MNIISWMKMILSIVETYHETITIVIAVVGGAIALTQWRISSNYNRGDIVLKMKDAIRNDEDAAMIFNLFDWANPPIKYNGSFSIIPEKVDVTKKHYPELEKLTNAQIMDKVDKTLSILNYICYLRHTHQLRSEDIYPFEYELKRVFDSRELSNYLHTVYHWAKSLGVHCSFSYLVAYGLKKKYLTTSFKKKMATDISIA